MSEFDEFESFEDSVSLSDSDLSNVAALARLQLQREREVAQAEAALKRAKAQLNKVQQVDLPELMAELGLQEIKLRSGERVHIDEQMYASISQKNKPAAISWLDEHGQGALVRNEVSLSFGTGEADKVTRLREVLDSTDFNDYAISKSVNTTSVKAAIRELLAQGVEVPFDIFGLHFQKSAKIELE